MSECYSVLGRRRRDAKKVCYVVSECNTPLATECRYACGKYLKIVCLELQYNDVRGCDQRRERDGPLLHKLQHPRKPSQDQQNSTVVWRPPTKLTSGQPKHPHPPPKSHQLVILSYHKSTKLTETIRGTLELSLLLASFKFSSSLAPSSHGESLMTCVASSIEPAFVAPFLDNAYSSCSCRCGGMDDAT
ncbi:hypothetical protein Ac2012v2_007122 [Leucoagaricus gongylophorus]